ncbi:MAG: polyprenyl diphosphate synthase [Oscillospiraceae bacterium]|nr:polyprenyl diphosphate synthase [Oscillospiraceae bacterium]
MHNSQLTIKELPNHIGIMMDGNRRWAKKRGLPTAMGHLKGADVFKERVHDLSDMGIKHATFFAFSTENLNRRADEVSGLMRLFESQLDELMKTAEKDIRLIFIGDLSVFTDKLQKKAAQVEQESAGNKGMVCRLALNYGGRAEITRAVSRLILFSPRGNVTEQEFADELYTKGAPDVDFIIRTGGEKRLSNFLLWQAAYAELYFTDTLWCDFNKDELTIALNDYASRNRRFGN